MDVVNNDSAAQQEPVTVVKGRGKSTIKRFRNVSASNAEDFATQLPDSQVMSDNVVSMLDYVIGSHNDSDEMRHDDDQLEGLLGKQISPNQSEVENDCHSESRKIDQPSKSNHIDELIGRAVEKIFPDQRVATKGTITSMSVHKTGAIFYKVLWDNGSSDEMIGEYVRKYLVTLPSNSSLKLPSSSSSRLKHTNLTSSSSSSSSSSSQKSDTPTFDFNINNEDNFGQIDAHIPSASLSSSSSSYSSSYIRGEIMMVDSVSVRKHPAPTPSRDAWRHLLSSS